MRPAPLVRDVRIEATDLIHKAAHSTLILHARGRQGQYMPIPIHYSTEDTHGTLAVNYGLVKHLLRLAGIDEAAANLSKFAGLSGRCFSFKLVELAPRPTGIRNEDGSPELERGVVVEGVRPIEPFPAYEPAPISDAALAALLKEHGIS